MFTVITIKEMTLHETLEEALIDFIDKCGNVVGDIILQIDRTVLVRGSRDLRSSRKELWLKIDNNHNLSNRIKDIVELMYEGEVLFENF